jgi:hypothetical protein
MSGIVPVRRRTEDPQRIARAFGIWFLLTWIFAIAARSLFEPAYSDPGFLLASGSAFRIQLGAVFEFLLLIANIATAVVLYPVVNRQSQIGAMGYVTARIMESAFLMVGLLSLVSLVALREDFAGATGADAAALQATGSALVSVYKFGFLFGPGLVVGFGNGLLLGWLMFSSGLVPRRLAALGFVGGTCIIGAFALVLFGVIETGSPGQALLSFPEMLWEGALPIYCLWKGFKPSPIISPDDRLSAVEPSTTPSET